MTVRTGQTFTMGGLTYQVAYVTPSRAHCIARTPKLVTVQGRTFKVHRKHEIDISTQSGLDVLKDLERKS